MKIGARPTDEQILAAMRKYQRSHATYVIRNILSGRDFGGFDDLTTAHVLYRLRKLEKAGLVREVRSSYAVMKEWEIV